MAADLQINRGAWDLGAGRKKTQVILFLRPCRSTGRFTPLVMDIKQNEDGWFDYGTQRSPPPVETAQIKSQHTGQLMTVAPAPVLVEMTRIEPQRAGPGVAQGGTSPNSIPTTVVPLLIKPDHDRDPSPDSIPDGAASQPPTAVVLAPAPVEIAQIKPQCTDPDYNTVSRGSTPLNSIPDETASQLTATNGRDTVSTIQALVCPPLLTGDCSYISAI